MVNPSIANRRGTSLLGCLVWLAVFGVALYYGVNIGQVYFRYYQVLDEMRSNARFSPNLADDVIQRRLQAKVNEVFGPGRPMRFRISRGGSRRTIVIETLYRDSVDLPLFKRAFVFKPRVEEPI